MYSHAVDVQGHIVEKLSGKTLGTFFKERIFDPLGMRDTGFSVSKEKLARTATNYKMGDKALEPVPPFRPMDVEPGAPMGGGGLFSTANDFSRFMQMLLNGGALNGKRLLKAETVALMRQDHTPPVVRNGNWGAGYFRINAASGFGLGAAIVENPAALGVPQGKGTYWWGGSAGTWFWIDPANDLAMVGVIQRNMPRPEPRIEDVARDRLYDALVKPEK